jgi:selenocysteine lyase/cysteine desulfurase
MSKLSDHFQKFRHNIIGNDSYFESPYGRKKLIYADWVASGRLYKPIEEKLMNEVGPYVANTHTETTLTGTLMTRAYREAHEILKKHANAGENDVIITAGFGMTAVINKFQRILGLKDYTGCTNKEDIPEENRPVVFLTHMEHHSNHTSWLETIADVVLVNHKPNYRCDLENFKQEIKKYSNRKTIIGSFTACSNVTGVEPDYYGLAKIIHQNGGIVMIDFAASAPYVDIDMHPEDPEKKLDAIFFSPHKFLGGPGGPGVLIFDEDLYTRDVPDNPGGGTVEWTDPWGGHKYFDDIELREDGGTPGFLQTIRAAMAVKLKEQLNTKLINERERELVNIAFEGFSKIKGLHVLADNIDNRLGIFSFWIEDVHYNLIVKLLNDRFGIQVRGGCACAGTYGHFLLNVTPEESARITKKINEGDLSEKPGFVRVSLHPTMTDEELQFIIEAVNEISVKHVTWQNDYEYNTKTNEFRHKSEIELDKQILGWFDID